MNAEMYMIRDIEHTVSEINRLREALAFKRAALVGIKRDAYAAKEASDDVAG